MSYLPLLEKDHICVCGVCLKGLEVGVGAWEGGGRPGARESGKQTKISVSSLK